MENLEREREKEMSEKEIQTGEERHSDIKRHMTEIKKTGEHRKGLATYKLK